MSKRRGLSIPRGGGVEYLFLKQAKLIERTKYEGEEIEDLEAEVATLKRQLKLAQEIIATAIILDYDTAKEYEDYVAWCIEEHNK